MKISLSFILNRIASSLVFYDQENKKPHIFLLDQIYFFEQSIDQTKINNLEMLVGEVFKNFDLSKFDELNEIIKQEKHSDFAERPLFQIKHLAEFYSAYYDKEKLHNIFSELNGFYEDSKPTDILLDHYNHIKYNKQNRLDQIGCLNYFTQSLHNNYLDLMYRQDQDGLDNYSEKFNDVLTKFYKKTQEENPELQKQITNIVMIGMNIKAIFEKLLHELVTQNNSNTIQYTALIFAMLFSQLPLYYLENQNDILIKSIESLKNRNADSIEILDRLYRLRTEINQTKSIHGFAYIFEKIGIEVEEIIDPITKFYQILQLNVVEITKIDKHPQSDRLNLCTVFDGYETKEIVCGGKNVHNIKDNNLHTILASLGQVIPCDMLLEPREIRGIISQGMLCSLDELCINYPENEIDGIAELPNETMVGNSPLNYILNKFNFSIIFDISITPNIGNFLGLYNLEDMIFSYLTPMHQNYLANHLQRLENQDESAIFKINKEKILISDNTISEKIIENIYFYECDDVTKYNGTHPDIKNLLTSQGFEVQNNIMDAVNFSHIMLGAYPHIIDLDKIEGQLKIKLNDKNSENLKENDIILSDANDNILAIPGLYDNPEFSFNNKTTKKCLFFFTVFKENSNCDPEIGFNKMLQIARRNKLSNSMIYFYERARINEAFIKSIFGIISTDYSTNDIENIYCINDEINEKSNWFKAVKLRISDILMLFKKIGILSYIDDMQEDNSPNRTIDFPNIGDLSVKLLARLGIIDLNFNDNPIFKIDSSAEEGLYCILPVFKNRTDINSSLDLVNEISKFSDFQTNQKSLKEGFHINYIINEINYENSEEKTQEPFDPFLYFMYDEIYNKKINSSALGDYQKMRLKNKLQKTLVTLGYSEVCNFSFIDKNHAEIEQENLIHLSSPVNKNLNILRPSIIPSLLNNLTEIIKKSPENISIFESGPIYIKNNIFQNNITGVRYGKKSTRNIYNNTKDEFNFYDIKADFLRALEIYNIAENDLNLIRINKFEHQNHHTIFFHPGKSAIVFYQDLILGYIGEIHPKILKKYEIEKNTASFVILIETLDEIGKQEKKSLFQSIYQEVSRDLAFFFNEEITIQEIKNTILQSIDETEEKILQQINVFDIYQDEKLKEEKKKSIALNFKLQSQKETLSDKKINKTIDSIILNIKNELNGILTIEAK